MLLSAVMSGVCGGDDNDDYSVNDCDGDCHDCDDDFDDGDDDNLITTIINKTQNLYQSIYTTQS